MVSPTTSIRAVTACSLLAASATHVAWGRGSTFPFGSEADLTDNVVGSSLKPSPRECYGVAAILGAAAALVAVPARSRPHRTVVVLMATVFAVRAAFGFAGRTDLLVPGSVSAAFRRNDRRLLSPLCAAIAAGIAIPTLHRPNG